MGTARQTVCIRLLGAFAVQIGERVIDESAFPGRRSVELVQYLALQPRCQAIRDQVIESLWPHLDLDAGAANLRKAAHHARIALGAGDAVVLQSGRVTLFPGASPDVDAVAFDAAARAALVAGDQRACAEVAATWQGELLPGAIFEDWTQQQRRQLHDLQAALLRAAARWEDLIGLEPAEELAYRQLMAQALASGARSATISWYGRLRAELASLGLSPDPATSELYRRAIDGLAPSSMPFLVGRTIEQARLDAARLDAASGRSVAVTLRGPAGIGKSTLCHWLCRQLERDGWLVTMVTASEADRPFGVIVDVVESMLDHVRDGLDELHPHARSVLASLTPTAGLGDPLDGPLSRHQVVGALTALARCVGGNGAVAFVVDDADLADGAGLEVITQLALSVPGTFVVLAHRDATVGPLLERCRNRWERAGVLVDISLPPLDVGDAAALVRRVATADLEDADVELLARRGEGNPFVISELARMVDPATPRTLPNDVSRAIRGRLVVVDPDALAVLRRLAVAADDLDASTVVVLTGYSEAGALTMLDQALGAGVLVVSGTRYRFRHDVVRQALVDEVPPHQRRAIHRDVARRLAAANGPPADIARHWLAAGEGREAVPWLVAGAQDALRLGAFGDAARLADAALEHADGDPVARRVRAEALDLLGDPACLAAYAAAIAVSDPTSRDDLVAMRALAQLKLGDGPGALAAIDGARPTSVGGRLSQALTYAGAAALGFTDPAEGSVLAAECRRLALESGDRAAIVVASWAQAAAAHARGELRDSVLADLADTKDLPELAVRIFDGQLCVTQRFLYGARPYDEVITFADQLAAEGERLGAARGQAFGVTLRGEAELLSGQLAAAERDLTRSARMHRDIGGATGEALALQRLAELELRRGNRDRALDLLDAALALARVTDIGFHLLDRIYGTRIEAADTPTQALAAVDEAEESVRGPLETCPGCRITFAVPAAITLARFGDLDRAREMVQATDYLAHVVMRLPAWDAAHAEVCAHLARREGDDAAAGRLFAHAAGGFERAGQPWDRDRCAALSQR
jgi:DNA-binding SARP family transcriptional activator